jgi:hypothetical protein
MRRGQFLAGMEQVVQWEQLCAQVGSFSMLSLQRAARDHTW